MKLLTENSGIVETFENRDPNVDDGESFFWEGADIGGGNFSHFRVFCVHVFLRRPKSHRMIVFDG